MPELFRFFIESVNDNDIEEVKNLLHKYTLKEIVDTAEKEETIDLSFYHAYKQNDEVYSLLLNADYLFYSKIAAEECLKHACEKSDREMISTVVNSEWIEIPELIDTCVAKCDSVTTEWAIDTFLTRL